jgi:hypothetical protein
MAVQLRGLIEPFLLRRLKADVAIHLPDKTEQVWHIWSLKMKEACPLLVPQPGVTHHIAEYCGLQGLLPVETACGLDEHGDGLLRLPSQSSSFAPALVFGLCPVSPGASCNRKVSRRPVHGSHRRIDSATDHYLDF